MMLTIRITLDDTPIAPITCTAAQANALITQFSAAQDQPGWAFTRVRVEVSSNGR